MEQIHEPTTSVVIPDNWKELNPKKVVDLLNSSTVRFVVDFAKGSPEAKNFVLSHKNEINDLNPNSIMMEDMFPTDVDNIYEFSVLVRIGHVNASGNDEEVIPAKRESDLREVLSFFSPVDFVEVKLTYPGGFEGDISNLIGRPLERFEGEQLKRVGIFRQAKRQASKKIDFLFANGANEDSFNAAKEEVLHYGSPRIMSTDVYDTALALEESERELTLELNMIEHGGPLANNDRSVATFRCQRGDSENTLC